MDGGPGKGAHSLASSFRPVPRTGWWVCLRGRRTQRSFWAPGGCVVPARQGWRSAGGGEHLPHARVETWLWAPEYDARLPFPPGKVGRLSRSKGPAAAMNASAPTSFGPTMSRSRPRRSCHTPTDATAHARPARRPGQETLGRLQWPPWGAGNSRAKTARSVRSPPHQRARPSRPERRVAMLYAARTFLPIRPIDGRAR
jgi:hypothetical protein